MADFTYDAGVVIDYATGDPVGGGVTLEFRATPGGADEQVYDLNGSPITLVTSDQSSFPPFSADINRGFLVAGSVTPQEVLSDQLQDAGPAAAAAQAAAEAAAVDAASSATASASSQTASEAASTAAAAAQAAAEAAQLAAEDAADNVDPFVSTLGNIPDGVGVIVSYYNATFSPVDTWPATRAGLFPGGVDRPKVPITWVGPSDAGSRVGPNDFMDLAGPSA